MTPDRWIDLVQTLGFPAAVCLILLLIMHNGLSRGFGAVHQRLDKADGRMGAIQYLLGVIAGEAAAEEAERMAPTHRSKLAANGEQTKKG